MSVPTVFLRGSITLIVPVPSNARTPLFATYTRPSVGSAAMPSGSDPTGYVATSSAAAAAPCQEMDSASATIAAVTRRTMQEQTTTDERGYVLGAPAVSQ